MRKTYIFLAILALFSFNSADSFDAATKRVPSDFYKWLSSAKLPRELTFCGERIPLENPDTYERADREFYLLLQQPGQIIMYVKRAGRYFPAMEKVLREEGAPDDLKYLAVAESALMQGATSGKGAHGLWQFMPATARQFGLVVNDYVDERRDPVKSARAAIRYLKAGYERHKSWILAAAGYNMGDGRVSGSLDNQGSTNFFDLWLNEETSRYIFRIAIIKEIMQNAKEYGFDVSPDYHYKPYESDTVTVTEAIQDLSAWAKANGTNFREVRLRNPWITGKALPRPTKDVWTLEIPKTRNTEN